MSVPLHTSDELHQRSGAKHRQPAPRAPTMPAAGVDADGLRCEVRSMRSVPHALYTLPSVAHVVAGYVRQLQDDFTSSLLLCRPAQRRVYSVPRDNKDKGGKNGAVVVAGASAEEEEAYLLLRLCALDARQRRQRRRAGHRQEQQQNERAAARADGGRTSAARTDSAPAITSMEDASDEDAVGCDAPWGDAAAPRSANAHKDGASHLQATLTEVDAQLLEMFAKAEALRRRGGGKDGSGGGTVLNLPTSAATPPLLSSLLRFKPLLRDMQLIARHVLLPRYAWPHHQREWVNVCEDVSVTLCDRLARYRNVLRSNNNADEDAEEEKEEWRRRAPLTRGRVVSADELERLWQTLWELLGAAWRQRDRLWGAYRYVQGPRQLPPLSLNGQAVLAVPPGVHASPILREHHLRHLMHTAALATSSSGSSGGGGAASAHAVPKLPPSLVAAHDEDSCCFGPFTSSDVGISAEARFVLRQPMAAALRLLRVCVPAAGRDALATSTSAFAGFKYVSEPVRRSQSPATSPAPANASSSAAAPPPVVVPLFDPTEEDVRLRRAVPYMAPEVYLAQQLRQSNTAPVHRFSDDVWNTAVVVLEAALCGFAVGDPAQCHLSALTTPATADEERRSGEEEEEEEARGGDGSPDAMPPTSTPAAAAAAAAAVPGVPTDSVYADVLAVLASHHRVSQTAAHNFLYATLHHLQKALKALLVDGVEGEEARCGRDAASRGIKKQCRESKMGVPPSPAVLAQEWVRYLCTHYDTDFVTRVLAGEVATRGLCWRRSERWNAFGMAHVTAATAPSPRAEMSSSSPLVAPTSPFGSACSESGSSWRGQRSAAAGHSPDALTSPSGILSTVTVAGEAGSASAADAPGRAFRLRPPLTVTLPSRLDSVSSLDVSLRSPLRCGSPTSTTSPTVARLPQRLDRAVNSMDTPLMPLFGVPTWTDSSSGGGHEGLWERLARFLRRRTASGKHQRMQQTSSSSGSGGGAGGKANGAVADAADVDAVEEFLHLLYMCVCVALRRGDDDAGKEGDDGGRTRFAAVNHPFLRGVAERGLLTTYMAVCGCARDEEGQTRTHETALQLYVPTRALVVAMAQLEEGEQHEARESDDRLAVAADIIASLDQLVKRIGTLRTFIGDDVRAWEAARDVSRRERAAYPTYFSYAASMAQPPAPVRRARPAVEAVLTPMDLSLPLQLHHVAALQRLCLEAHGGDAASTSVGGSGGSAAHAARQVRAYLHSTSLPTPSGAISPFFAVPPTIRGAVWGCLLHVPPARKREAVFAHALQRTAAKPSLNDRQLAVDIPRCHAYHPLLSSARGSAQLQRLLRAWLFLHPRFAYWQGLDSVCAVLLTVSPHDEALVLAQLSAVVEHFIAHDEGGEEGLGSRSSLLQSPPLAQQQQQQQGTVATKPSMSDQLHRLTAVLRYCDPLLAHYLFSVLGCTPELYAISWLLTVFSHSLPTRKVYLLWDLLFSYGTGGGSGTCLVALCAAVVMHRRSRLLSCDFTGCLSAFGSGAAHLDVAAAVGDTRQLMAVLPPSVLAQPCAAEEESRLNASQSLYNGGQRSATVTATVNEAQLPTLSVEDVKAAWDVARRRAAAGESTEQQRQHWSDSGVYLVDVRPEAASDALLGAIHLPLQTASLSGSSGLPPVLSGESFGSDTAERGEVNSFGGRRAQRRDDVLPAAGEGWGIVADQERLHEQQQLEREAQERHIADAAAELVRHLNNPAVAAIAPRGTEAVNTECTPNASGGGDGVLHGSPPWPVHPIVLKTSLAPHVVLVATGVVSYGSAGGFSGGAAAAVDGEDVLLAHQLGLRLNACGVHNVSVLRGGAVAIRLAMPELVVPHSQRV